MEQKDFDFFIEKLHTLINEELKSWNNSKKLQKEKNKKICCWKIALLKKKKIFIMKYK